eukprot:jgi/Psemu1/234448/estExt_Genewise1.C_160015
MLQMSLKDRNNIIEEIHGVQNLAPDETPEMIDSALRKMHAEILMIPSSLRRAYDRSQRLAPTGYINNAEFRLRFLRCDLFNANRAARRMVQFLDLLGEIFGDVALKRPVMLKDFSKDEINAFRTGYQQLLPYRDQSGRRVFACVGVGLKEPLLTRVKIFIYSYLAASEDVETQRKGLITIIWPKESSDDESNNYRLDRIMFMKRVYANLPVRSCSIHFCCASAMSGSSPHYRRVRMLRTLCILTMPHVLNRMKFHTGQSVELLYTLRAFGIPSELIPVTDSGNVKTVYLKQWMKQRRMLDAARETGRTIGNEGLEFIECPGLHDVVFRTGTSLYAHPGNVRFRCLLESKHENPVFSAQSTRAELAMQIIEEIQANGGKFLRWDSHCQYWTEIELMKVLNKVLLAIRDFKYKTKVKRAHMQTSHHDDKEYLFVSQSEQGCNSHREF